MRNIFFPHYLSGEPNIVCRLAVCRLLKTKSGTLFKNSAWVEGGARTHDIQNHNLTL